MTTELEKFARAKVTATKFGYDVRKADYPNDLKRYTLTRHGVETHFATTVEVLAELERVKP